MPELGQRIRAKVLRWTGLPVCVGFGATKTLSKLANHLAKKRPEWNGVCDLTTLSSEERLALSGDIQVGEVWGVGRRIAARLAEMRITTVRQLQAADPARIRQAFNVVLERTVLELRGVACIPLEETPPPKQQIMVSRSFGSPCFELAELANAVSFFVARGAEKLRKQESCAGIVLVFIQTSYFRKNDPQYSKSISVPLVSPTDDTLLLTEAVLRGLRAIYRPGFPFAKAGVMLTELVGRDYRPRDLFEPPPALGGKLMETLDRVNAKFGRNTLTTAAALAPNAAWRMRQDRRSPKYTTDWNDLIRVPG